MPQQVDGEEHRAMAGRAQTSGATKKNKITPTLQKLSATCQKGEAFAKISSVVALKARADIKKSERLWRQT